MCKKKPASPANFEEQMARLQVIVQELERPDVALERGVSLYKEGCMLADSCRDLLSKAKNEIALCGEEGISEFKFDSSASEDDSDDSF